MSEPREKQISGYIGGVYRKEGVSRMLHIIDNYYAQTNNYGYSVLRDTGKKEPKDGQRNIQHIRICRNYQRSFRAG